MTPWEIHGAELANCNCDTGCPCQFMSLPTKGTCEAAVGFIFERGHYGDVDLSGTRAAQVFKWPGAVHEGNGTMQTIIDESATPEQRDALEMGWMPLSPDGIAMCQTRGVEAQAVGEGIHEGS